MNMCASVCCLKNKFVAIWMCVCVCVCVCVCNEWHVHVQCWFVRIHAPVCLCGCGLSLCIGFVFVHTCVSVCDCVFGSDSLTYRVHACVFCSFSICTHYWYQCDRLLLHQIVSYLQWCLPAWLPTILPASLTCFSLFKYSVLPHLSSVYLSTWQLLCLIMCILLRPFIYTWGHAMCKIKFII